MRRLAYIILFLSFAYIKASGQDAHFSQFYASGLYLNPALAGAESELTFKSSFRTQWRSITLPYMTSQISLITPLYKKGIKRQHWGGAGISFFNDKAGDGNLKTFGLMGTFAYNLALSSDGYQYLIFGGQGGVIQKNIDYTNLEWGEQFNPYVGFDASIAPSEDRVMPTTLYPDINFGAIYYFNGGKNYLYKGMSGYFGASVYHLLEPNESMIKDTISKLPRLYKAHAGIEYHLSEKLNVSGNFLGMYQGDVWQANLGAYMSYELIDKFNPSNLLKKATLITGVWYRYGDAFIWLVGLENDYYTLGFSYDINSSSLRTQTRGRGAYEVTLSLRRVTDKKMAKFSTPRI